MLANIVSSLPIQNKESPVQVETGHIGYSKSQIKTRDLDLCSAVILDFGDSVLLAHALPTKNNIEYEGVSYVTIGNVVDKLVQESRSRGLDYTTGEAIINAGNEESLEYLKAEISERGMQVLEANTEKAPNPNYAYNPLRTVHFDPRSNKLKILYQQE